MVTSRHRLREEHFNECANFPTKLDIIADRLEDIRNTNSYFSHDYDYVNYLLRELINAGVDAMISMSDCSKFNQEIPLPFQTTEG
jgi:hypothetical protein